MSAMMKRWLPVNARALFLSGLVVLALAGTALSVSSGSGAERTGGPSLGIMAATCTTCHGENGWNTGTVPSLSGLPAKEIRLLLFAFKSGEKFSTIMKRIMTPFGEDEIRALAEYFAAQDAPEGCGRWK